MPEKYYNFPENLLINISLDRLPGGETVYQLNVYEILESERNSNILHVEEVCSQDLKEEITQEDLDYAGFRQIRRPPIKLTLEDIASFLYTLEKKE